MYFNDDIDGIKFNTVASIVKEYFEADNLELIIAMLNSANTWKIDHGWKLFQKTGKMISGCLTKALLKANNNDSNDSMYNIDNIS